MKYRCDLCEWECKLEMDSSDHGEVPPSHCVVDGQNIGDWNWIEEKEGGSR